jgi:dTDP-4-amino-4,6-dideoxygalactose transaminase
MGVKLECLDEWNKRRQTIARRYLEELQDVQDLKLPRVAEGAESCWHLFVVRHSRRDALQRHLKEAGIATLVHYPIPPHLSGAYAGEGWKLGDFPVTEELAETVLSLPIGPHLNDDAVTQIIRSLHEFKG